MNKSLSYVNLSLELHVVSTFWLGSGTSSTFSLHFAQPSYELERPALKTGKMLIRWCSTGICICKLSAKVSLRLDNQFLVPSYCKLNHISVGSSRLARNYLQTAYSLHGKQCFFWSHPWCFGLLRKFQLNIKISIKTAHVSRLSASYYYGFMLHVNS